MKENGEIATLQLQLALKMAELEQKTVELSQRDAELEKLKEANLKMEQELLYFKRVIFGKKSERFIPQDPNQLCLNFNAQAQLKEETANIKPVLEEISQESECRRRQIGRASCRERV